MVGQLDDGERRARRQSSAQPYRSDPQGAHPVFEGVLNPVCLRRATRRNDFEGSGSSSRQVSKRAPATNKIKELARTEPRHSRDVVP